MEILQKPQFEKTVKKLHENQKADVKKAIQTIIKNPDIGELKKGDLAGLAGLYVYKFKMTKQPMLLAYSYEESASILTLIGLGSHENFYRGLKR